MRTHAIATGLAILAAVAGEAAARPYGTRGVVEMGGLAQVNFTSLTTEVPALDSSSDTSTTTIQLQPIIGYFVAHRVEIVGGLLLSWEKDNPDMGEDTTVTGLGALAGAGYYVPAGSVFLGPRLHVGYTREKISQGDSEDTEAGPFVQGAGALRVPFASGGLLELAAALTYEALDADADGTAVGDRNSLSLSAQVGFFIFF